MIMKKTVPLILLSLLLSYCSQEKKLLRKASAAVDNSEFDKALGYYDQCIKNNDKSFFGYAGKGIVLSEYMGRHEQAIPFLEKALANSPPEKTKPILNDNLARSYHFIGNYKRALQYYGNVQQDATYAEYDQFLSKRIADCKYAIEHPEVALPENQTVANIGGPVNTEMPEYTPVVANGNLYFTSKRQDTPKEKKNGVDGKYFESVYVSKGKDGAWTTPEKVTLTEVDKQPLKLRKSGEAVASASPDGKSLFIYKEGKIYTTPVDDPEHKLTLVDKTINFAPLQNHAALAPDGNTLYFTSESDNGRGGSDIYYSTKDQDGKWSMPVALDNLVNTQYDEDAPYVNEDGVLFFSSNGHPGYGGFDVYRTQKVNGVWAKPVNLGQPINSPGDDIFFTLSSKSSNGLYASARPGGHGDLDIYKVHYVITDAPPCKPEDLLTIDATPDPNNSMSYNVRLNVPEQYRNNIKSYNWEVNGKPLAETKETFTHQFDKADTYKLAAKVVAWCDTCPTLVGMCREQSIDVKNPIVVAADNTKVSDREALAKADDATKASKKRKNGKDPGGKNPMTNKEKQESPAVASSKDAGNSAVASSAGTGNSSSAGTNSAGPNSNGMRNSVAESNSGGSVMSESELSSISWNSGEAYFDYDDSKLKEDAKSMLSKNVSVLKSHENLKLVIHGYADSRGAADYNKKLSERRAQAVKSFFISQGISSDRIRKIKAHGENDLVNQCTDDSNCDDSQHKMNRRVHVDVVQSAGQLTSN
jgi:outer membrane protein OmpA-like peptidoglycan-associated protein